MAVPRRIKQRTASSPFDLIRHVDNDPERGEIEWWSAREAMPGLGYARWENMANVVRKAKSSCRNGGHNVADHFRDITKTPTQGGPSQADTQMSRFGMYLLAMNGDPDKAEIAAAQRYFAVQARRAELELTQPQVTVKQVESRPWGERLARSIQDHRRYITCNFFPGSFSTYTATIGEILWIESELLRHQLPMKRGDLPDGSIGKRFALYLQDNNLGEQCGFAPLDMHHITAGDKHLIVQVRVYPASLRTVFERWLNTIYIPQHMPEYFKKKPAWKKHGLAAASAADNASRRLVGKPAKIAPDLRRLLEKAGGFIPAALPGKTPEQLSQ